VVHEQDKRPHHKLEITLVYEMLQYLLLNGFKVRIAHQEVIQQSCVPHHYLYKIPQLTSAIKLDEEPRLQLFTLPKQTQLINTHIHNSRKEVLNHRTVSIQHNMLNDLIQCCESRRNLQLLLQTY
jgi:hypothetical protein